MISDLDSELIEKIRAKKCVFTITAGRTGTNYLQKLFALFPDTLSLHEGTPEFVNSLRRAQQDPDIAYSFSLRSKLPFIASTKEKRYVETSHLFCKGFAESFLKCGIVPDIIILRRPPRQIAVSNLGLSTVPARTVHGFMYLLSPDDPNVLPLSQWQYLNDYQLCFWYSLEIERRQRYYGEMYRTLGATVIETTLSELLDFGNFVQIASQLGFPASVGDKGLEENFLKLSGVRHNERQKNPITATPEEFAAAEEEVWERIYYYDPLLRSRIEKQYEVVSGKSDR
ncbi:MAG: hypothetical protein WA610_06820 [Thermodesulfovibrionales bacterium]